MRALVSMVGRNRTAHAILAAGLIAVGATVAASDKDKRAEWRHYLGGQDSASYSSLTEISTRPPTASRLMLVEMMAVSLV